MKQNGMTTFLSFCTPSSTHESGGSKTRLPWSAGFVPDAIHRTAMWTSKRIRIPAKRLVCRIRGKDFARLRSKDKTVLMLSESTRHRDLDR